MEVALVAQGAPRCPARTSIEKRATYAWNSTTYGKSSSCCKSRIGLQNATEPGLVLDKRSYLNRLQENDFFDNENVINRLDEVSDEEDLDLIPPRPVDDRCQCCGAVTWQGCIIS